MASSRAFKKVMWNQFFLFYVWNYIEVPACISEVTFFFGFQWWYSGYDYILVRTKRYISGYGNTYNKEEKPPKAIRLRCKDCGNERELNHRYCRKCGQRRSRKSYRGRQRRHYKKTTVSKTSQPNGFVLWELAFMRSQNRKNLANLDETICRLDLTDFAQKR